MQHYERLCLHMFRSISHPIAEIYPFALEIWLDNSSEAKSHSVEHFDEVNYI